MVRIICTVASKMPRSSLRVDAAYAPFPTRKTIIVYVNKQFISFIHPLSMFPISSPKAQKPSDEKQSPSTQTQLLLPLNTPAAN